MAISKITNRKKGKPEPKETIAVQVEKDIYRELYRLARNRKAEMQGLSGASPEGLVIEAIYDFIRKHGRLPEED